MKTHCPQGHEYIPANTYTDKNGYRHCKVCRRDRMKVRRPATVGQGAHNSAKTHCPKGHEYTAENTWVSTKGSRTCRTCARANSSLQTIKKYGITLEQFEALREEQNNECPLCGVSFDVAYPCVDHDHACCSGIRACGKCVGGLLCSPCNRMLGDAKDDPAILRAAADYLERVR